MVTRRIVVISIYRAFVHDEPHCMLMVESGVDPLRTDIMVYLLTRGAEPMLGDSKSVVDQARRRQARLQAG